MLRIGVDMIEVERVQRALARHGERFYARFFTARERQICAEQPQRLAARFAAKEAAAKALGTGIGEVRWVDLEIDCDERGSRSSVTRRRRCPSAPIAARHVGSQFEPH